MEVLSLLFQGIIAFCAFFALLSAVIKLFLAPIKEETDKIKRIEGRLNHLEEGQAKLEKGQAELRDIVKKILETMLENERGNLKK